MKPVKKLAKRKYTKRVKPVKTEATPGEVTVEISQNEDGQIIANGVPIGEVSSEEAQNVNNCEYRLTMQFNGEVFDCFTNNLKVSMLSFRPQQFHTEGYIKIEKGTANFERRYSLIDLRQLMTNEERLDIFIANLLLG